MSGFVTAVGVLKAGTDICKNITGIEKDLAETHKIRRETERADYQENIEIEAKNPEFWGCRNDFERFVCGATAEVCRFVSFFTGDARLRETADINLQRLKMGEKSASLKEQCQRSVEVMKETEILKTSLASTTELAKSNQREIVTLTTGLTGLRNDVGFMKTDIQNLQTDFKQMNCRVSTLEGITVQHENRIGHLEGVAVQHENRIGRLEGHVSNLYGEVRQVKGQMYHMNNRLNEHTMELTRLNQAVKGNYRYIRSVEDSMRKGFQAVDETFHIMGKAVESGFRDVNERIDGVDMKFTSRCDEITRIVIEEHERNTLAFTKLANVQDDQQLQIANLEYKTADAHQKIDVLFKSDCEQWKLIQEYGKALAKQSEDVSLCISDIAGLWKTADILNKDVERHEEEIRVLVANQELTHDEIEHINANIQAIHGELNGIEGVLKCHSKIILEHSVMLADMERVISRHAKSISWACQEIHKHNLRIGDLEDRVGMLEVIVNYQQHRIMSLCESVSQLNDQLVHVRADIRSLWNMVEYERTIRISNEIQEHLELMNDAQVEKFTDFLIKVKSGVANCQFEKIAFVAKQILAKDL